MYYRVKLGFDGYTSIKSVLFQQITTGDQRFFPNPVSNAATLVLNASVVAPIDLLITDAGGRQVLRTSGGQGPTIPIDARAWAPGIYTYAAVAGNRVFQGRFIKL